MYFHDYCSSLSKELALSVKETTKNFLEKLKTSKKNKICNTLLLGHIQSGKTAQVLGLISALADVDKKFFIYMTTDSVDLQKQTFERVKKNLDKFSVLSENDLHFFDDFFKLNKPVIIVIKKNNRILRKWKDTLNSKLYLKGYSLTLIDDEADASSLNTKTNTKKSVSPINQLLDDIKNTCNQCLFIEVTATPQAIILQNDDSDWRPEFIQYFEPGEKYVSGNFVFSTPQSYIVKLIDDESENVKDDSAEIPDGLKNALKSFLVTCAEFYLNALNTCNFIVHPSMRVKDHEDFKNKISEHLNEMAFAINNDLDLSSEFFEIWQDFQKTKPDINYFDEIYATIKNILENQIVNVVTLNSKTEIKSNINSGFNIIIGGNIIGRGLTIPKLQTVYYSRMSKKPNADTFWQHSRIFGYDRDKSLLRLFIPHEIYKFFVELNIANNLLIQQSQDSSQEKIQIIYPKNIRPTRKNVLDNNSLCLLAGNINYFPDNPDENNLNKVNNIIEEILDMSEESQDLYKVDGDLIISILLSLGSYNKWDWNSDKFISCIRAMQNQRPKFKCYVLIKTNRKISKGTGTMLSPTDRKTGDGKSDDLILTLYQITGETSLKWQGNPFWLPNIKFPKNIVFWDIY